MKIFFSSLGCDKNLSDSEHMIYLLQENGHILVDDESMADVAIVNTCAFIHDAKKESIDEIFRLAACKKTGKLRYLVITGCLSERYQDEIQKQLPEIDGALGISNWDQLPQLLKEISRKKKSFRFSDKNRLPNAEGRQRTSPYAYSYLKIAEGCSKNCSYCAIPAIRGKYRSIPLETLLEEAREMVSSGIREICLVAQETTIYGVDLYGKRTLPKLLRELGKIEDLDRIRLLYCYPEEITDELILEMKRNKKVVHYLDMPIQHASDSVLKSMNRRTTRKELTERIRKLRDEIPDITLRTTVMVGFPGETDEDFQVLKSFVKRMKFDHLGVFAYSKEEGTEAYKMKNQVLKKAKVQRQKEILEIQKKISYEKNQRLVGSLMEAFVDGSLPEQGVMIGRTFRDAPDVDGVVYFTGKGEAISGCRKKVRIIQANEYDLVGEEV